MAKIIERGDIYFFYRTKIDVAAPENIEDVQRLHLVLIPDDAAKGRLLIVGKKQMAEIDPGQARQSEREWLMTAMVARPEKIGDELRPLSYTTKTRGKREQGEAIPAGEGRYALFEYADTSRLAYKLSRPRKPGELQHELGIQKEASYILSVRNPELEVPGFPTEKPKYPKRLRQMFAEQRWLNVSDSKLLDYKYVQLVLIGAHENLQDSNVKITGRPDLFGKLAIDKAAWPSAALTRGKFAKPKYAAPSKAPAGDRGKGGRRGGRKALQAPSAAGIARALKGIEFPGNRAALVNYAKEQHVDAQIIDTLAQLPRRKFKTMADVEKALGEIR